MNTAEVVSCDGSHVWLRWHGARGDRDFVVPLAVPLEFRDGRSAPLASVDGSGEAALIRVEGRHSMRPLTFIGNCLSVPEYQTSGARLSRRRSFRVDTLESAAPEIEPTPASSVTLVFGSSPIGMRGSAGAEQLSLTDMWRANGSDPSKEPARWLRSAQAQGLLEFLRESANGSDSPIWVSAEKGARGGTWAHWQLAFAFAKYLSAPFHAWVNQAAREKMQRGPAPAPAAIVPAAPVAVVAHASTPAVDMAALVTAVTTANAPLVALLERLLPVAAPAVPPGAVVVPPAPEDYPMGQGQLARRLGLPEHGEGHNLVGGWARTLNLYEAEPYSRMVPIGLPGRLKEDGQVRYSDAAAEALAPAAHAAIQAMTSSGFSVVGGRLKAFDSKPTTMTECVRKMREAGLGAMRHVAAE